ncbi:aspartyl-phosphate phosphatase Spo0E family protein [Bacillus licheniformis]|nr:aspartyl-phosphate phosphatase Spo0E family protein [Bacillus licheniformis]
MKRSIARFHQQEAAMMVEAAEIYGYTGDETIRRSQELDQLIYEYQNCL